MELKPCPFCGGEVYPTYWSKTGKFFMTHYKRNEKQCCVKQFEMADGLKCLEDVYKVWNERAKNEV